MASSTQWAVRRSLLLQKAYAEGLRALVLYNATVQDRIAEAEAAGTPDLAAKALNDLLLPIVKGYGSERTCEQLNHALQVFGGAGYLKDFPLEQYIRDTKNDTLYEGTTAIQGLDLFFRKIARDQGATFALLLAEVEKTAQAEAPGSLAVERAPLAEAIVELRALAELLGTSLLASFEDRAAVYEVGRNTTRLLMAAGDVLTGWLLLRQADVAEAALARLAGGSKSTQQGFYWGKIATARFFTREVLPLISSQRAVAEREDTVLMSVPDEAW
ncbi:acyl-CoA dehydrogenase C-terminal domain-containing protein [Streptomyces sp. NPDC005151]